MKVKSPKSTCCAQKRSYNIVNKASGDARSTTVTGRSESLCRKQTQQVKVKSAVKFKSPLCTRQVKAISACTETRDPPRRHWGAAGGTALWLRLSLLREPVRPSQGGRRESRGEGTGTGWIGVLPPPKTRLIRIAGKIPLTLEHHVPRTA